MAQLGRCPRPLGGRDPAHSGQAPLDWTGVSPPHWCFSKRRRSSWVSVWRLRASSSFTLAASRRTGSVWIPRKLDFRGAEQRRCRSLWSRRYCCTLRRWLAIVVACNRPAPPNEADERLHETLERPGGARHCTQPSTHRAVFSWQAIAHPKGHSRFLRAAVPWRGRPTIARGPSPRSAALVPAASSRRFKALGRLDARDSQRRGCSCDACHCGGERR
jgi:hypothetical protein